MRFRGGGCGAQAASIKWAVLAALCLVACDPNAKVVRSGQQEPEAPKKEATQGPESSADPLAPGTPISSEDSSAGSPSETSQNDKRNNSSTSNSETGQKVQPPIDAKSGSMENQNLGTTQTDTDSQTPSGGSSTAPFYTGTPLRTPFPPKAPLPPGQSGAKATGRCDTGDWGACFREARPLIASNPQKAMELYLKACLPGQPKGDGLACQAAGMLAESMGNTSLAKQYFASACRKPTYPVISACGR